LENARRSLRLLEGLAGKPEAFRKECGKAARKECGKAVARSAAKPPQGGGKAAARSAAKPLQGGGKAATVFPTLSMAMVYN